jgi:type I restriction enzyme, R subunit
MSKIGKAEKETQDRVIKLFTQSLGYHYLGDKTDQTNSNVETEVLSAWLKKRGYDQSQINRALDLFQRDAHNPTRSLYENNKAVYEQLRYGVKVKTEAGQATETVWLIDWDNPQANDFAIAEEVTLKGNAERRPDLVLYVNGIAMGVIELKRSAVSIGDGMRQLISNQKPEFNAWFFSTVQIVLAGNDTEGMRYGTIGTPEKMFLSWKEDEADNSDYKLDKYLAKMCAKDRLIEIMHDFILFDGGIKKLPRVHQYFGIKAAQRHVKDYRGGVIWHTQGSGKSIVMVLLAKWILENKPNARILIITDRDELDKQIERVFTETEQPIARAASGADLVAKLSLPLPRLLCSLVHKFGRQDIADYDAFIRELRNNPPLTAGELFVFVDECHRTQSGKLHMTMKALLPSAVFIGFTGTPLLKQDKATSNEVFGGYIHTYKFGEAVDDGVVLDLVYEARDIPQEITAQSKIDQWFDAKTKGLNDWQKAALREQWGTMQNVLSSRSRMERLVADIVLDFSVKPRLVSHRGNAILVASSIFEACKYYELFEKTEFKGRCAVITSYNPNAQHVTKEDTGANTETDKQFIYNLYVKMLEKVDPRPGKSKTETYEDNAKERFIKEPANMRLLIVVDKLLTGFDAPSCSYLYIDKSMQDHGLFQAICRTNRLDGDDKQFGYIVDYKDLFNKVQGAIAVYTKELDDAEEGASAVINLKDRLKQGRETLEVAREAFAYLCDPVQPPKSELDFIHYFCGNIEIPEELAEKEPLREALYKCVAILVRSYAALADNLIEAGYTAGEAAILQAEIERSVALRETVRHASGETIDLKAYEADMRYLIDTYIKADEAHRISNFENIGLLDLIVKSGIADAINSLPKGIKSDQGAVAETIANNIRSKILQQKVNDPAFYERMSDVLDDVIADIRARRITYEDFLQKIADLAKQVQAGKGGDTPVALDTPAKRALYNNLGDDLTLALAIDAEVKLKAPAAFRGNMTKENIVKQALLPLLNNDIAEVERIFEIIKAQSDY